MLKEFMLRQMLKSHVPEAEQEKLIKLVSENPELFQNIAAEVQAKMSGGKNQMDAVIDVLQNHKDELQGLLQK
jgi:hypothetical protein